MNLEIHRDTKDKLDWRVVDLNYDPVARRFKGSVVINSGTVGDVVAISGRAMPMSQVAVLTRPVGLGDSFDESAVEWVRLPMDKTGADAVTDKSQLEGVEARRNMDTNTTLRLRDLAKARLVVKGSLVTMTVHTDSMEIATHGRALNDAVMGEAVRVLNTQSNRTVDATVTGRGKVSVTPAGGSHLALAN